MGGQLLLAFAAGLVSFATPCVLPLVPGYLSVVGGVEAGALGAGGVAGGRRMVAATVPFVLGFTVVFTALGAAAGGLGDVVRAWEPVVARAAGLLVVAMGFALLGLLPLPGAAWLGGREPGHLARRSPLLLGAAFAVCFAPCIGPVLTSVLALASTDGTAGRGAVLLLAYSLGLALPFLLVGAAYGRALGGLRWLRAHQQAIGVGSGCVLVAVGLLLFFDRMWWLRVAADRALQALGIDLPTL